MLCWEGVERGRDCQLIALEPIRSAILAPLTLDDPPLSDSLLASPTTAQRQGEQGLMKPIYAGGIMTRRIKLDRHFDR
jgi:hypothetical protein